MFVNEKDMGCFSADLNNNIIMKPIQEKITNETDYRNHLHKLNEENVKLKKEVRHLKNALTKAQNLPKSNFKLALLNKVKKIAFGDGSAQERMVDIKALLSNEA